MPNFCPLAISACYIVNKFDNVQGFPLWWDPSWTSLNMFWDWDWGSLYGEEREIRAWGVPVLWEQRGQGVARKSLHDLWLTNGILGNSDMELPLNRDWQTHMSENITFLQLCWGW